MHISCSSQGEIWEIPDQGLARIAGYWNPDSAPVCKPTLVEWQQGKITALRRWTKDLEQPDILMWDQFFLLPGWLDAHVHLALDSIDFQKCFERWPDNSRMEEQIKHILEHYLKLGVVGIRDGGDLYGYAWLAKNKIMSGEWVGPKILSVHEALFRTGNYGRFLGRGTKNLVDWKLKVEEFYAQGLDQLKVIITGLISFHQYGIVGPIQWSLEDLKHVIDDAHRRGIRVMAHVSGTEGITMAMAAGVDSIEHGYYITSVQLKQMAELGIAWVPTVAPVGNLVEKATHRYNLEEKEILRRIVSEHLAKINEAYQLKVSLGIGTDAGAYMVPHGDSLTHEMIWFAEAGIPTLDVRRIATVENAKILGWSEFGRLQTGVAMDTLQLSDQLFGMFCVPEFNNT